MEESENSVRRLVEFGITATTVLGLLLFLPARVALGSYYGRFDLSPEDAGVSYTEAVTAVAVLVALVPAVSVFAITTLVVAISELPALERPARVLDRATDAYLRLFEPTVGLRVAAASAAAAGVSVGGSILVGLWWSDWVAQGLAYCAALGVLGVCVGIVAAVAGVVGRAVWRFVAKVWQPTTAAVRGEQRAVQAGTAVAAVGAVLCVAWACGYLYGGRVLDGHPVPRRVFGFRLPQHGEWTEVRSGEEQACLMYLGTADAHVLAWNVEDGVLMRWPADSATVTTTNDCLDT